MRLLVTGASGFVGGAFCCAALKCGFSVRAVYRHPSMNELGLEKAPGYESLLGPDLSADGDWRSALAGVDAVVHTAARVHVISETKADAFTAYRKVNVEGTVNLARQSVQAGVRRFVFVSSIKVNGEATRPGQPFCAEDAPSSFDPYGLSKLEAEQRLLELSAETGIEVVIVRPPLIYGPGVKANFASMMRWVARGVPLPLGRIHNARSMVALDNLLDLLITCLTHPAAAGQIFLVSDGEDVSTTELLRRTARAMDKKVILLPVPASWLKFGAAFLGKRAVAQRLCGSLQVDIGKTRHMLGWNPRLTLDQGLKQAVKDMKP